MKRRIGLRQLASPLRRRIVHPELKSHLIISAHDVGIVGSANPAMIQFNGIPQNATGTGRDGRRIWQRGGHLRLLMHPDTSGDPVLNQHTYRIIIVKEIAVKVATAAVVLGDFLETPANIRSFAKMGISRQYRIMYDRTFVTPKLIVGVGATVPPTWARTIRIKVPVFGSVIYAPTDTSGADIIQGEMSLFIVSDLADVLKAEVNFRMRFTDS